MKLEINLNMDSAPFQPTPNPEAVRILRGYADRVEAGGNFQAILRDADGASAGFARIAEEDPA